MLPSGQWADVAEVVIAAASESAEVAGASAGGFQVGRHVLLVQPRVMGPESPATSRLHQVAW
jgi:hypothetical protein